ncbi:MAG TPA: ribonuclease Y [Verrucomicrobiae bacterium]|nr:ribonuclease Y [Verrucomicrobiae bacterium]
MESIVLLVGIIAGLASGFLVSERRVSTKSKGAEKEAEKIVKKAQDEAEKRRSDLLKEAEERQEFLRDLEKSLKNREESLNKRGIEMDRLRVEWEQKNAELVQIKEAVREIREKQEASLERIGKMTKDEAKQALMNLVEKSQKDDLLRKMKALDDETDSAVDAEARKRLATVLARISSDVTAENTVFAVTIPSDEMKGRLIGKEGRNIMAFEKATGVDLLIDDSPDTVLVSSFDPVRREIGRLALSQLIKDGRIQPARIEEVVKKAEEEVSVQIRKAGEAAVLEAKVSGLPKEIVRILGQLKYRTSYGQNMLAHSIEVSKIAGLIAEELGANVNVARTAGLLHDLGKALDHDIKAPHHHISADLARKYKLSEDIVHAIIAHHDDVDAETTEAWIIRTADAISGARPGARRGSYEEYVERLRELENVANAFPGVDKSFAIQAGREVRVFVRPNEIDDLEAAKLAKEIAAKVEAELTYPGQVRVNVIRETRHQAFAS